MSSTIKHPSHPHVLKAMEIDQKRGKLCSVCVTALSSSAAYCCTEAQCTFNIHIDCFSRPETVTRLDHEHPLILRYSNPTAGMGPNVTFMCDVCRTPVHETAWVYYCPGCDFGTHLDCVTKEKSSGTSAIDDLKAAAEMEELLDAMKIQYALEAKGRRAALELLDGSHTTYKYDYKVSDLI